MLGKERHPPEEKDVNGDGADVPDGMGIQDPEERREVQQLEQGQPLQQQDHLHTLVHVRQALVPQAPGQPPCRIHQAWGWAGAGRGSLPGPPFLLPKSPLCDPGATLTRIPRNHPSLPPPNSSLFLHPQGLSRTSFSGDSTKAHLHPKPAVPQAAQPSLEPVPLTHRHVDGHIVAVVEADETQVGDVHRQHEQQEGPDGTGHGWVLQPHGPAPPPRAAQTE